jgi:hypothetical protein
VPCPQEASSASHCDPSPLDERRSVSGPPRVSDRSHNYLPNYPGEELETLDSEILVISADVPPQDGETDEQHQERENANAARAIRRQQELVAAVPTASQQLGQQPINVGRVNDNAGQQAPAAPAAPQQRW